MKIWRVPPILIIHLKRFQFTQHFRRKLRNMVVFPIEGLDLSHVIASDTHESEASNGVQHADCVEGECSSSNAKQQTNGHPSDGRSEALYDLYAVVHHLGALTGGHYVASVRSGCDGKWKLFNDALVTEISSRDIVDASAYILFYVRRDVKNVKLEDLWDVTSHVGEGITEEQINTLTRQRDRCVVS